MNPNRGAAQQTRLLGTKHESIFSVQGVRASVGGCACSGGRQVEEQRLGQQGRVSEEVRRLRGLLLVVVLVVLLEHEGGRGRRPRAQQRRERPQQRVLLLLLLRLQLRGAHVAQLAPAR